ncbi:stress responsive a b barrel domain protein [Zymoseptoria brevis]|uniref:Stress responsive a b barrel domain protein n=1 Tax=Zymoseptoria brevis TaxID=1047168 RepID=A0A0F4GVP7_9PEZI|nr:stress responsive a b barrel domain protein [Zymoseptoria brevis]
MTVYHIVLFKLKFGYTVDSKEIADLKAAGQAMVGQIPGLSRIDFGPPLASTANRSQGYDLGLVAILEKAEDVKVYAEHPSHQKVNALRLEVTEQTLAYDLVVEDNGSGGKL